MFDEMLFVFFLYYDCSIATQLLALHFINTPRIVFRWKIMFGCSSMHSLKIRRLTHKRRRTWPYRQRALAHIVHCRRSSSILWFVIFASMTFCITYWAELVFLLNVIVVQVFSYIIVEGDW